MENNANSFKVGSNIYNDGLAIVKTRSFLTK